MSRFARWFEWPHGDMAQFWTVASIGGLLVHLFGLWVVLVPNAAMIVAWYAVELARWRRRRPAIYDQEQEQ